jgi:trimethylamine--corrinoid protein Co-methyltransferase
VGLAGACAAHLAHRHGLTADVYGFCTASTAIDPQLAYDKLLNALTPALAGADILSGVGMVESGLTGSPVAAVIDDEIISLMRHLMGGCEVSEQTLAFETMQEVILGDGVFLGHEHTVEHMRRGALWMGEISERGLDMSGEPPAGVAARARERALDILASHQVEPLPEDVSRHLTEIMEQARRELVAA